ncbi:MAG: cytochrome c3 family protein [Bryobacterales bacterium]|nr:cytochrome c3 family protein [Bryobacterales bacterium]
MRTARTSWIRLAALLLSALPLLCAQQEASAPVASSGSTLEYCLRCHSMSTLGQASDLGHIRNFSVDPEGYRASVHGTKNCTFCHYGFNDFPHTEKALARAKTKCTSCHRGEKFADWGFDFIREEFEASVHFTKLEGKMTCFSCHDPHQFDPSRRQRENPRGIRETVAASNAICLKCHHDTVAMAATFAVATRPLEQTHAFLPNRELHWAAVRCLDCHTPENERMVSHKVLPKEEAVRNCVDCHSQESRLLTKLYRHRVDEERQRAGFLNSVVLNDAYLVGMTRNKYLDWLSIAMALLTALGITMHAVGRYLAIRKEKRQ